MSAQHYEIYLVYLQLLTYLIRFTFVTIHIRKSNVTFVNFTCKIPKLLTQLSTVQKSNIIKIYRRNRILLKC